MRKGDTIDQPHMWFKTNGRPYLDPKEIRQFFNMHGMAYWCWGAENFAKVSDSTMRFEVSGLLHKGYVYIYLNGSDAFDLYFVNWAGKILEKIEDVYLDQLFSTIDAYVEQA